ncbi:pre-mRNA-splicing factor [Eremomyces bilateralis CBS 781.70]|uniref:Pre-mRNA-splicing factor n=1 Tax=Eremomyces bilateralis CBS 781.70 TaxID=1392243 RepID=A0A6G1GE26_9PEZI|nr:pre-mRNA-splicing factor [Eremomyces bilateralis CBS 781.70]KAF1816141.1 pre-mRNA-splicing factor [Eremomyces bilateralis CBS 781.70]
MSARKDFLGQPAPENYVAGLGRGATGFTTRSDLGPAREGPSEEQIKEAIAKRAAQVGAAAPTAYGAPDKKPEENDDNERYQDPENEVGLFASGTYDRDDDEADRIYQDVDERMNKRRKIIREARENKEREDFERNNPKIQQQFADLKRALGSVTDEEWQSIPEVGDLTGKNRRAKQNLRQRFYAVPDTVIAAARDAGQMDTTIADDAQAGDAPGGDMTNFVQLGAAREKMLQVRLDNAVEAPGTKTESGTATTIDPKGYLTNLVQSEMKAGELNIGEIQRVRKLLESVRKTNPKHAPAWGASARLEKVAGNQVTARNIIAEGCKRCPKDVDLWLENIALNDTHNAKIIAAQAILYNDRSIDLWLAAMNLETDTRAKKKVLRQALDNVPMSARLWKEAVNLEEDPNQAKMLLAAATEQIPLSIELWLALARLETPENAQVVLNKARKAVPTSHEIWVAAGRLQEQMGHRDMVYKVMERGIKSLARESAMLKREEWIAEAEKCEAEGAVLTCGAIIRETLGWGLDEDDDRREIWMEDAQHSIHRGRLETPRAIYAYALRVFVNKKSVWLAAAELERSHGANEELLKLLEKGVEACPNSEEMWLQLAKERWSAGETDEARRVLGRAFTQNPNNENIWLAAVKLEADNDQIEHARGFLADARREAGTDRVWIKSVTFERVHGDTDAALDLVSQGLQLYPKADKLWMMKGQIYEGLHRVPEARQAYSTGTRACSRSVPLWLLASRLEENQGTIVKARSILDRARLAVPHNPELWTESVRLERRANDMDNAHRLMAQALQEAPSSGLLWGEKILYFEARTKRKTAAKEAIEKVGNDPVLFVTLARIFWAERKLEVASKWFEKAVVLDSDRGDTWAWYYKFLLQHGTEEKRAEMIRTCVANEPKHGEVWQRVAKDPGNAQVKNVEDILKLTAAQLESV